MRRVVVVSEGGAHVEAALGSLGAAGLEAVRAGSFAEARALVESGGVAVVIIGTLEIWQGPAAQPVATLPNALRRGSVIVLVIPGIATGDGSRAFLASVDLVIAPADSARLGELVAGALQAKRALVGKLDPVAAARLGG